MCVCMFVCVSSLKYSMLISYLSYISLCHEQHCTYTEQRWSWYKCRFEPPGVTKNGICVSFTISYTKKCLARDCQGGEGGVYSSSWNENDPMALDYKVFPNRMYSWALWLNIGNGNGKQRSLWTRICHELSTADMKKEEIKYFLAVCLLPGNWWWFPPKYH